MTACRSRSTKIVLYVRPLRRAHSSTPSTRGAGRAGNLGAADHTDECRGTGRHAHAVKEPATGRTAEGKGDGTQEVGLPCRPSGVGQHNGGQALGEDALRTVGCSTGELAHPQLQLHSHTAPRQVGQGASITSADARRALITAWTVGGWQRHAQRYENRRGRKLNMLKLKPGLPGNERLRETM